MKCRKREEEEEEQSRSCRRLGVPIGSDDRGFSEIFQRMSKLIIGQPDQGLCLEHCGLRGRDEAVKAARVGGVSIQTHTSAQLTQVWVGGCGVWGGGLINLAHAHSN